MTFLNPAILWGLFAVSIPIIIHIFNLKKTRKIEFSTLMFLKEIQETKQKRIKLKQLLILLCRIAFIIFLVLMFADPLSKGFLGAVNDKSPATVLILLDDSFSLTGRTTAGTDFDLAKLKCNELIEGLDKDDELYFVPLSKIDNVIYHSSIKDFNSLKDSISAARISDITKPVTEILIKAKRILSQSKYPVKEIYFVTDGQSSAYESNIAPISGLLGEDTRLSIILTSSRTPNNLSIDSIDVITKIFTPNRTIKFNVSVTNHNNFNASGKSISFSSGSFRDEKIVDIPAGSSVNAEFTFSPPTTGFINGVVELTGGVISEDEFPNDNKRNTVFYIPSELNVLMISQPGDDAGFVELAIASSEAMTTDSSGRQYDYYKIKKANNLIAENPGLYNSLIIINKNNFSEAEAGKIKEYLENGGGLILYPGGQTDVNNYNEVLFKTLNLPYIPNRTDGNIVFEKIDFNHPVFEGMFKSKISDIKVESPLITSVISPQQGEGSQTLIKLSNGQNFLEQYNYGKSKILIYAVPPDNSWSDFPQKSIFPPLTVRSIQFISNIPEPEEAITGKEYYLYPNEIPGYAQDDSLFINYANKKTHLNSTQNGSSLVNLEKNITAAGIYDISVKQKMYYEFAANTNPSEARTAKFNAKEIKNYFETNYNSEVSVLESRVTQNIREARTGKMLWQYFLIGALFFLAAEFLLAKSIK